MHNNPAIPTKINLKILALVITANIFQFFLLPIYLLPQNNWWALTIIPIACLNIVHWSLIHESIHKLLHPNTKINNLLGRTLSIVFGASLDALRFGHLMHHRFNRQLAEEFYYPNRRSWLKALPTYYWRLLFGTYFIEVIISFALAFLPQSTLEKINRKVSVDRDGNPLPDLEMAGQNYFFGRDRIASIRTDVFLIIAFFTASGFAFADNFIFLPLIIFARGLVISMHDNVYHYGTEEDTDMPAKELKVSNALSRFMLHFNYHQSHHLAPNVPWTQLPQVHEDKNRPFTQEPFIKAVLVQLRGPILVTEMEEPSHATQKAT